MDEPVLDSMTFKVKRIIAMRLTKEGKPEYRVRWYDTWEAPEMLTDCQELVTAFHMRLLKQQEQNNPVNENLLQLDEVSTAKATFIPIKQAGSAKMISPKKEVQEPKQTQRVTFACKICRAGFNMNIALQEHMRKKHNVGLHSPAKRTKLVIDDDMEEVEDEEEPQGEALPAASVLRLHKAQTSPSTAKAQVQHSHGTRSKAK